MSKPGRLRLIINAQLRLIKRRHRLTELTAVRQGSFDSWTVTAKINPEAKFELFSINDEVKELRLAIGTALKTVPKKAKIDEVKVDVRTCGDRTPRPRPQARLGRDA